MCFRPAVQHSHKGMVTERTPKRQAIGVCQPDIRHGSSFCQLRGKRWQNCCTLPGWVEGGKTKLARLLNSSVKRPLCWHRKCRQSESTNSDFVQCRVFWTGKLVFDSYAHSSARGASHGENSLEWVRERVKENYVGVISVSQSSSACCRSTILHSTCS